MVGAEEGVVAGVFGGAGDREELLVGRALLRLGEDPEVHEGTVRPAPLAPAPASPGWVYARPADAADAGQVMPTPDQARRDQDEWERQRRERRASVAAEAAGAEATRERRAAQLAAAYAQHRRMRVDS